MLSSMISCNRYMAGSQNNAFIILLLIVSNLAHFDLKPCSVHRVI